MKYAVAGTFIREYKNYKNIMGVIKIIEAVSEQEAWGKFLVIAYEQFPEHNIYVRPVALLIEEEFCSCAPDKYDHSCAENSARCGYCCGIIKVVS